MTKKKAAIILNDFRSIPFFAAIHIFSRFHSHYNLNFVISSRYLDDNAIDYGDYLPAWYKKIKIYLLRLTGKLIVLNNFCPLDIPFPHHGIQSSLCSITQDSGANSCIYPELFDSLWNQSLGAIEVANYLIRESYDLVFLFNGRTASSSPIVEKLFENNVETRYYEFSSGHSFDGYVLFPYPVHDSNRVGYDLKRLRQWSVEKVPSIHKRGLHERKAKLSNNYVDYYKTSAKAIYYCSIFLGSDHEITNLLPHITNMMPIGNYELVKRCIDKYIDFGSLVVRAHPNQRQDMSANKMLEPIVQLCKRYNIDYYSPDSSISSHSLIMNSSIVAAEYSSIVYDAIYLGKPVDIFSNRDLSVILDAAPHATSNSPVRLAEYVSETVTFSSDLYYHSFGFFLRNIPKLLHWLEFKIQKRNSVG